MTGIGDLGGFGSYLGIQGFLFFCPHPPCFSDHGVGFLLFFFSWYRVDRWRMCATRFSVF